MTLNELLQQIALYTREVYGRWPRRVRIDLDDGEKIAIPVPTSMCTAKAPTIEGVADDLAQAIFSYLDDQGEKRTREQVSEALSDGFSESSVHKALWHMRVAGILSNTKGLGYGLSEWEQPQKKPK